MFENMSANQKLALKWAIILVLIGIVIYLGVCLSKLEVPNNDINREYSTKRAKYIYGIVTLCIMTALVYFMFEFEYI